MNSTLADLIRHPEQLDKDTLYALREIVAKYPYYQAARLLFLQNLFLLHDASFGEELRKAALYLPDRKVLFRMVEGSNYEIQPTPLHAVDAERASSPSDRTEALIDDFLRSADDGAAERPRKLTAADATTDYAAFLLQMDDAVPEAADELDGRSDRSAELIDDFIENEPPRIQLQETPEYVPEAGDASAEKDDGAEDGFLTMTLAKIYIRQQRYEKALEIMRKVHSGNPKQSTYFTDQIRFLQKLIVNKSHEKPAEAT